jgi:hypothetical protein
MDFIGECLKWFDRFLRRNADRDEELPALRAWMPDPVPFGPDEDERPGRLGGRADAAAEKRGPTRLSFDRPPPPPPRTGSAVGEVPQFGDLAGRPADQRVTQGSDIRR